MASAIGYLKNTPFLRYLLFFSAGILAYLCAVSFYLLCLVILCMAVVVSMCVWRQRVSMNIAWLFNGHLALTAMAFLLCWKSSIFTEPSLQLSKQAPKAYKVCIHNHIAAERYEAVILAIFDHGWEKASGKLALTIKGKPTHQLYDTLYILGTPSLIKAPLNPEEFDYQTYSKNRGIFLQHYIQSKQVLSHRPYTGFSLHRLAYDLRVYFSKRLRQYIPDADHAAIAEALVLGMRSEISPELINAYAQTGTIHVLAVSGMHIGVLFATITWLFSSLMGSKHKIKYSLVALLCMWFFALVTGFSASVLRATVMYTVYQVGVLSHRKVNLPNTLFSSAFIILLFEPFMLFDVGFQLSFFAVLGIVLFQPFFQTVLETSNTILKNLRDLITVSISAQLGVLPLSLFYFKQFPNLFIISNLLEISLSTVALYIGLLCMVFMAWDFAMLYLCKALGFLIYLMNKVAQTLADLPFATTKAYIYPWEAVCLAGIVLTFAMYLCWKKIGFLKTATLLTMVLSIMLCLRYDKVFHQEKAIIYALHRNTVIDIYKNGTLLRIRKDIQHSSKLQQLLEANQLKNGFYDENKTLYLEQQRAVQFTVKGKKVWILNDSKRIPTKPADVVFLNYKGEPSLPSFDCLLVVKDKTMAQKLRDKGYHRVHCLETGGALDI